MAQQEALQVLAGLVHDPHRGRPCPDKVAHRLMRRVRHPDRRQLASPVQLRQHHSIAAVRLHPVPRLYRNERRRHHDAVMPQFNKLTVKTIPTRPRLVTEMQSTSRCGQLLHQLADMIGPVQNRAPVANLTATFPPRNRDRNRRLVDIQPDERATLHLVSPPFLRHGTRPSGATLE